MFWFNQKTDEQLENALLSKSELTKKVEKLEAEIKAYEETLKQINNEIPSSTFVFDFKAVKAFSVERNINNNVPVTIIGYFLPEARVTEENGIVTTDTVREWYFYCNQEQHEKLVEEFRKSKK